MQFGKICLIGGTGFIGWHLATELARQGYSLKVLTRRRERHRDLLVFPKIDLVQVDVHYVSDLTAEIGDCDAVINTVGVLNPIGSESFARVHGELPGKIAEACAYHQIPRLIHVSALGAAEDAPSEYLRTKWRGEMALADKTKNPAHTTIVRPSVVFGPGDSFFNRFADLLRAVPGVFPLAKADAKLQPVYVGDLVQAICLSLESRATWGQTYEIAGPQVYTLRELVEYAGRTIGVSPRIWPLPDGLAELQAKVMELLPNKPLSLDNLRSLDVDSTTQENALDSLGINPTSLDAVVPRYLGKRSQVRRFSEFRRAAGR